MKSLWFAVLFGLMLGSLFGTSAAHAQSCGGVEEPECPPPDDDDEPAGEATNSGVTRELVKIISGANETCDDDRIELRYRIDCLRIYYLKVADRLPERGDYLPVKQAMIDAAERLDAIVAKYEDTSAPVIRPREGHKSAAKRLPGMRAVKENFAEAAAVEAAMVVEETELIIIRSGGDPARRTQHYTEVAAAVEDNLVILRSS
ncbi:hypothetical protein [Tabrizicola sp.]|jgi:hypothetical protein|uniref:hypothetical protein n=1 Tax=Tabrizicola sp. TaxID=2005166 RepID=UPI0035AE0368